jgi:hypothetical protein
MPCCDTLNRMARENWPLIALVVKTLKLVTYLFLETWSQIWFQKYYICSYGTQYLINKDKNRGKLLFTFPHPSSNEGNEGVSSPWGNRTLWWWYVVVVTKIEPSISVKIRSFSYLETRFPLTKNKARRKIEKMHKTYFFEIFSWEIFYNFKIKYCRPLFVTSRGS